MGDAGAHCRAAIETLVDELPALSGAVRNSVLDYLGKFFATVSLVKIAADCRALPTSATAVAIAEPASRSRGFKRPRSSVVDRRSHGESTNRAAR
jgi:hypothetical protein